jgi:hypothetical protein
MGCGRKKRESQRLLLPTFKKILNLRQAFGLIIEGDHAMPFNLLPLIGMLAISSASHASLHESILKGDLPGIFHDVENGGRVQNKPVILWVTKVLGFRTVKDRDGVSDDLRSGPLLSVDKKITLIHYLKSKGADPNFQATDSNFKASLPIHNVSDARLMATLLDIGADPLLRDGLGQQALIKFLLGYKYCENKPYFRKVVTRLLEAGADPEDCWADRSGCVLDVAKKYGDAELVELIESYIEQ